MTVAVDKIPATERSSLGSLEQRTEIASQGMKGLFLINGGGAVALLAFLQSAWTNTPALVPYVASGIVVLILGLAFAASVPFVRIAASLNYQAENFVEAKRYSSWHRILEKLAIAAFVVGVLVVVAGVFANRPDVGQKSNPASEIAPTKDRGKAK